MSDKTSNRETRAFYRAATIEGDEAKPIIVGYAIVWDAISEVIHERGKPPFRETIRRGAFTKSLETADVKALYDHNTGTIPLGRNKSGTLRLEEDDIGLRVEIDPPDTTLGRDIVVSLRRGDLDKMSFGFYAIKDEFRDTEDGLLRELIEGDIFDVSVVVEPAYPDTSVAVRRLEQWKVTMNESRRSTYKAQEYELRLAEAEDF